MSLYPAIGGAPYTKDTIKIIRLIRKGCANRPFFLISVMDGKTEPYEHAIEQIGSYDPLPNAHNEKLVAINFKRLEYWLQEGAKFSTPLAKLLGLAGYLPIHPITYEEAWNNRKKISETLEELKIQAAKITGNASEPSEPKES